MSRAFLAPFIMYLILKDEYYLSAFLIILAGLTDFFDGIVARKFGEQTYHGKLLDPAVDKIFTISVLSAFVEKHYISSFFVYAIVFREMIITWLRSVVAKEGNSFGASNEGKIKTTLQFLALILLALKQILIGQVLLILSILIAYYSGLNYFRKSLAIKGT
jgi:CDP-diacylglycerol--glycerol-3-phosphate 3-phosphatidyltransferase